MKNGSSCTTCCPVCRHADFKKEFLCTDFFVTGETFPLWKCMHCGFRMTGSAPDSEKIGLYYQSEEYISHSNIQKGFTNKAYHRVREFMLQRKRKIILQNSGKVSGSLLDVGAGTGFFLQFMKKKGWEVTGTEKSETARLFAHDQWNLSLLRDEALFSLPDQSFDIITLWHVLEHLLNPEEYLTKLWELLKPSGTLLIALPNPESTDASHYKEFWAAWDVPRHLWHFSPENVRLLAENKRFTMGKIYRMPFDAFYISILSEKYRKSDFPVLKGLFFGMISWFISLFRSLKCSSLVYVLNRQ